MQGPFSMATGAESVFHLISGDLRLKSVPITYRSDDGLLSCRLTSYTPTNEIEEVRIGKSRMINNNNNPEDLYEVDSLGGKERLLEIMKAKHIAENFPVRCETEGEAIEIIKKLLDS